MEREPARRGRVPQRSEERRSSYRSGVTLKKELKGCLILNYFQSKKFLFFGTSFHVH